MKKILFIHHGYGWGGAPISLIRIINKLDHSVYEIEVLLFKKNSIVAKQLAARGIKYRIASSAFYNKYYFGFIHSEAGYYKWYQIYPLFKSSLFWILSRYYFANNELAKHEFDIVHLNSSIMSDWLAPAKKRGNVVIHIREPFRKGKFDILHHVFTSQMRKYADRIIAISEDNANRIGIPDKTEVIYEFVEIPGSLPPEKSFYSKKILYLGGAEYIKGFYTLLKVLDYLDKDVKVYFGGNYFSERSQSIFKRVARHILGCEKKSETAIKTLKNHPNAIFIGLIYNVQQYLDKVCCLISPFAKPHFSLPVIEAFASHKPVIVTDIEGIREVVRHKINGLIVPKDDVEEIAKAINFLCYNGEKANEMGGNGFKEALEKYSPSNIDKIVAIYNML